MRQQLLQLHREGWVESQVARGGERGRTGRPATNYSLTEAGDHLFPKHYSALNVAVLDAVADELGAEAVVKVLRRISNERVVQSEESLRDLTLAQRVAALKDWYGEADPYMQVGPFGEGDFALIERNCPFINTALHRPALCSVSVNALTRLLGVRVRRDETFQQGDGRCVFHVYANEPVDPETWEFQLESSLQR